MELHTDTPVCARHMFVRAYFRLQYFAHTRTRTRMHRPPTRVPPARALMRRAKHIERSLTHRVCTALQVDVCMLLYSSSLCFWATGYVRQTRATPPPHNARAVERACACVCEHACASIFRVLERRALNTGEGTHTCTRTCERGTVAFVFWDVALDRIMWLRSRSSIQACWIYQE